MIRITTDIAVREREPEKQACSLLGECVIEAGSNPDYKQLACFHYRNTSHAIPAVHQIYRARHVPSSRTVGVIVYAAAALNLGIRNRIFGDRFLISGAKGSNDIRAKRLNQELELIIRVVVHPTFRGTGLGQRLIAETLPRRPYRFVEMSAAMSSINPFAERAGMTAVECPRPVNTERVLASLRAVGLTEDKIGNPAEIMRLLAALPNAQREAIEKELLRYETRWIKSRTKREANVTVDGAVRRVAANALLTTVYCLWSNPNWKAG